MVDILPVRLCPSLTHSIDGVGHPYPEQVRMLPVWLRGTRKEEVEEEEMGEVK